MTNTMKHGALLALLLGGLGACAPAQDSEVGDEISARAPGIESAVENGRLAGATTTVQSDLALDVDAIAGYEALVAAKPAAETGVPFHMTPHKAGTQLRPEPVVSESFSLKLDLPKSDFVLGEPVILRTRLTNTTDAPLEVAPLLDVVFDRFQVEVTLPDGTVQPYRSMIQACTLPKVAIRTLQPGETFSNDVKIFAPKGGWLFAEPGDYVVNARLKGMTDAAELVVAEPIELTVLKGSAQDQAVANMIMDGQAAILLDWRDGDMMERGRETLETVVRDYPDTIHAIYAGHTLGNMWSDDFARIDGARPADHGKALSYLRPAFERVTAADAPVVSPDVATGIVDRMMVSLAAKGQIAEMRATADTLAGNPRMAEALTVAQAHLAELR